MDKHTVLRFLVRYRHHPIVDRLRDALGITSVPQIGPTEAAPLAVEAQFLLSEIDVSPEARALLEALEAINADPALLAEWLDEHPRAAPPASDASDPMPE